MLQEEARKQAEALEAQLALEQSQRAAAEQQLADTQVSADRSCCGVGLLSGRDVNATCARWMHCEKALAPSLSVTDSG